jgi:hypothetical protein
MEVSNELKNYIIVDAEDFNMFQNEKIVNKIYNDLEINEAEANEINHFLKCESESWEVRAEDEDDFKLSASAFLVAEEIRSLMI